MRRSVFENKKRGPPRRKLTFPKLSFDENSRTNASSRQLLFCTWGEDGAAAFDLTSREYYQNTAHELPEGCFLEFVDPG